MKSNLSTHHKNYYNLIKGNVCNSESILEFMLTRGFFESPASTKYHGVFRGGLAAHCFSVYNIYRALIQKNNVNSVDKESIIKCAFFHDLCKVGLYLSDDETDSFKYNTNHPSGHAKLSIDICKKHGIRLNEREENIIRYHMSYYYCNELRSNSGEYTIKALQKAQNDSAVLLFYFADHLSTLKGI